MWRTAPGWTRRTITSWPVANPKCRTFICTTFCVLRTIVLRIIGLRRQLSIFTTALVAGILHAGHVHVFRQLFNIFVEVGA